MTPPPPPLPSDAHLLDAARQDRAGAWDELVRRHGAAVTAVAGARRRTDRKKAVERVVDGLRERLVSSGSVESDSGVRAVRPRLLSELTGASFGPGESVDDSAGTVELPVAERAEIELDDLASIARAFSTLPEAWQTALWHRNVEQQQAAEYAALLGRSASGVKSVVDRADVGLFEAFLSDQRSLTDVDAACHDVIPLLGGAQRTSLPAAEQRLVDAHVDVSRPTEPINEPVNEPVNGTDVGCSACARRLAVGRSVSTLLPAAIVPALTGLSVDRYRNAVLAETTSRAGAAGAAAARTPRRGRVAIAAAVIAVLAAAGVATVLIRNSLGVSDTDAGAPDVDTAVTTTPESTTTPDTSEPADTAPAPTTTELLLRPAIEGPVNEIVITFDESEGFGFAPRVDDLAVTLSSPGPVFAGGTGTIDMLITNDGAADVATRATLAVPSGVVFDALVDGAAVCTDPADDSARCDIDVSAQSTERITVRFRLQSSNVGGLVVTSNLAADDLEVPITAVPRLVHSSVDEGEIIVAGNTLMTCVSTEPDCANAQDGVGEVVDRWDLPAEYVGGDRGPEWINSSAATVDFGGAAVAAAYLFWSGDLSEGDAEIPDDGRAERVSFLPPGSQQPLELVAERVRLGDVDATQYFGTVDVTDLVKFFGPGDYTVGNVESVEVQGSYAGWALVIVTSDESLPRRSNIVLSPFAWFSPDDTYAVELDVVPQREANVDVGVVAFEGERSFAPEQLELGTAVLGDAVFNSSIVGERTPNFDNNLGIDIDVYDLVIDISDGTLPIKATSDNDGIRLAVLALAVEVE